MNRRTAASERSALIRLAYSLREGSPERLSLLEGLIRTSKADGKVRPFAKTDWFGFGGATSFQKVERVPPWIAEVELKGGSFPEGSVATVIGDAEGIAIVINADHSASTDYYSVGSKDPEISKSLVEGVVKVLQQGRIPTGFRKASSKRAALDDIALQIDLPSYAPSDWEKFLLRPLKALLRDPSYEVYVLGGVGNVPYLVVKPKRGALEADFITAVMRDFNPLVKRVLDIFREKGVRISLQDVVRGVARRSPKLVQALREAKR